jgi:uncharacterized protein YjbJ (UPF0337 family)
MRESFHRDPGWETCAGFAEGRERYSTGVLPIRKGREYMDTDRVEGKAKKLEGKLTGDESREAEGRLQEKKAKVKDVPGDTWEAVKDKAGRAYNEREERNG